MWGENSKECESNCQCSGLITDSFKINSGNSATKRRREEAISQNFKLRMNPNSLDFSHRSPSHTPKRRVLGEIQNSPLVNKFLKSPSTQQSPLNQQSPLKQQSPLSCLLNSPKLNSPFVQRSTKISRIFKERTRFRGSKMANKENEFECETFIKFGMSEDTRDSAFSELGDSPVGRVLQRSKKSWTLAKMSSESPEHPITTKTETTPSKRTIFGHGDDVESLDPDFETLHDLDAEFNCEEYDQCSKYEIISTDSPDIISRGRTSSSRKISSKNFVFGAPIAENEQSTSFNTKPNATATRMLNFEEEPFEFTSPDSLRPRSTQTSLSVKKSLKFFVETPTKNILRHENSNSSIGSMSTVSPLSIQSTKLRLFPSESMNSVESGFMSEIEEPFLDLEDTSNSPKVADFGELLSGKIKDDLAPEAEFALKRPTLLRSLSYNPEASKVRISLFSKGVEEEKKSQKRTEPLAESELSCNKRRKANCDADLVQVPQRPVLQRAYSENAASVMSALARSASDPDLIGDFSLPFALPTTPGYHADLKSISTDTLADLLGGQFKEQVANFQVIDCRYPYEFCGGHIVGARNLYTPQHVLALMGEHEGQGEQQGEGQGRRVIVFHCEFSIERGPKLSRFLRKSDRAKHHELYPSLHYPEIYLLHEGYSAFYRRHPHLCVGGYTSMMDPHHRDQLAAFRRNTDKKLTSSKSFRL